MGNVVDRSREVASRDADYGPRDLYEFSIEREQPEDEDAIVRLIESR